MSEDITFCANEACDYLKCERNPKHIKLKIPHSFSLFPCCPRWSDVGAKWLDEAVDLYEQGHMERNEKK
jgi:hypothetical protein